MLVDQRPLACEWGHLKSLWRNENPVKHVSCNNGWKPLTILVKSSILDVWKRTEYTYKAYGFLYLHSFFYKHKASKHT